jgi:c(7)-type cytochrome triheme protein
MKRAALVVVALVFAWTACHAGQYGDVVMERKAKGMDDVPAAVFPHWIHRMQYKCGACHEELFKMKAGANEITMDMIQAGKACGSCHNGKAAFVSNFDTCPRCHYK